MSDFYYRSDEGVMGHFRAFHQAFPLWVSRRDLKDIYGDASLVTESVKNTESFWYLIY